MDIKFRENFNTFHVEVIVDSEVVYSHDEYRGSAIWTQQKYGLSDAQLMEIYRDYKEDYDENR